MTRTPTGPVPRIAVLTPVYNEEQGLREYERAITSVLFSRTDVRFEVLFIDDGSKDRSWELIEDICAHNDRFRAIRLSRNFGAHIALAAGFDHAEGQAVAILACDLQDPPETVVAFVDKWLAGAQIVWGKRRQREDVRWRRVASRVFFRLLSRFAMPKGSKFTTGSFLLADRTVVDCFLQFRESNRITFALIAWTGFRQEVVEYDRRARVAGASGWTFARMIKTMYDAFIGFSNTPIRLMTVAGAGIFAFNVPMAAYLVVQWTTGTPLRGYTSLMFAVTFFFGIQFLLMGLVGEYLHRIYSEVVRRPLYFISSSLGARNQREHG